MYISLPAERNIGDYTGIETNGERQANHRTKRRGRKGRKFIKPKPTTPKPTEKPTNRTILPDIKWTKGWWCMFIHLYLHFSKTSLDEPLDVHLCSYFHEQHCVTRRDVIQT